MFDGLLSFIRELYPRKDFVPLHEPVMGALEKEYLMKCIDSTYVSSVGPFVTQFEKSLCDFTGAKHAVATVNGTAALHSALYLLGAGPGTEVLTQALTFIATANAIRYQQAHAVFIDSDPGHLGMSEASLEEFLTSQVEMDSSGQAINRKTKRPIKACVPMHVFGHPVRIEKIVALCDRYRIPVIEDAAESLGSWYKGTHTGLFGKIGTLSFNGNKTVTCGGGGALILNDEALARRAKHVTTTAKVPHSWEFNHDELGFNYRLPNLNASMACAQMEQLPEFLRNKRETASKYKEFCSKNGIDFVGEPADSISNYWLNAIRMKDLKERNLLLETSNKNGVMTRPIWTLMTDLPMYKNEQSMPLIHARKLSETIVNLPSSVRLK